ncbi:uncharacterized protein [Pseudorca crassidens]|uniref:uncharacterized protein isoform X2 n=1 Tax=Pseudorca crassidens TaxID=82174 RepID=UPI00352DCD61
MGARQRVERRKRPRVSSSSWKPLSTVPAQPWSSHHPYCRGKVGEYLSFISGPTPASRGADPHPPRDRRPYEAASLHAKLRLLNACSARTYLSSPQPAALLCTSTHRALPPPCCHGDRPGPQQPLIGPTRRVEGADWQGRRPGRAGGLGGGRCGELTRRSPGEGEPGGTWRSAARAEKPRPFLLWLSWRVLWSRIWDPTGHHLAKFFTVFRMGEREAGVLTRDIRGPLTVVASPIAEHRLRTRRLSNHGSRAQPLRGMWDLPGPGHEPVSPASAGGLSTTAPPGKPKILVPQPGIEPGPSAVKVGSPTHWTTREFPKEMCR